MLEVYWARNGEMNAYFTFPLLQKQLEGLKMNGDETHIVAVDSSISSLEKYLKGQPVTDQTIKELDFLGERFERLTAEEEEILSAALEIEKPHSLMEIVNLSCNLNKFQLYQRIWTEELLGKYVVEKEYSHIPEELIAAVDYKQYGQAYLKQHPGFTSALGYVLWNGEELEMFYDGQQLPESDYKKNSIFKITCFHNRKMDSVYLPVPDIRLEGLKNKLEIPDFESFRNYDIRECIEGLRTHIPCGCSVKELNQLASVFKKILDGSEEQKEKLFAALEAECPGTAEGAIQVAESLNEYDIVMRQDKFNEPADYARRALREETIYRVDSFTAQFIDYEALGVAMMKKDSAVLTTHGIVINQAKPISLLPEERLKFRFFSPLMARMCTGDEWEENSVQEHTMYSEELTEYREKVQEALKKERLESEGERGLAVYLDNLLLGRKVYSMNPAVEEWDGKLWGVLEVETYGRLSDGEMEELKARWEGQCSDGFGEGFEQRPISTVSGELYVSFYQSEDDFEIKTEEELKGNGWQETGMEIGGMC